MYKHKTHKLKSGWRVGSRVFSLAFTVLGLAFFCLLMLTACGYHFSGRGDLPGNIQTLSVQMLENRSSVTGVETTVTNALINELNRRRQGSVVGAKKAEAVLKGTVESITWDTITRKGVNTASERRVYATLSLVLEDRAGKVLWQRSGLQAEQAYVVVDGNKAATEANRLEAIGILSEQMAEYIYRRLTDNF